MMIALISLFGVVSTHALPYVAENCPEFTKQFCACNGTDKVKTIPMRMCINGDECKPCDMDLQENVDCTMCPGNKCPICSENESDLYKIMKKERAHVKTRFSRTARKIRRGWTDPWCEFLIPNINGQLRCDLTHNSKDCVLTCYDGYKIDGEAQMTFACKRRENVWVPPIQTCIYKPEEYDGEGGFKKPEEPQQDSMPHVPELKEKSENDDNNDFDFDKLWNAVAGASPADPVSTVNHGDYDDDDYGKYQDAQSGNENAAASDTSDDFPLDRGGNANYWDYSK